MVVDPLASPSQHPFDDGSPGFRTDLLDRLFRLVFVIHMTAPVAATRRAQNTTSYLLVGNETSPVHEQGREAMPVHDPESFRHDPRTLGSRYPLEHQCVGKSNE